MKKALHFLGPKIEDGTTIMLNIFLVLGVIIFGVHMIMAVPYRYPLDYGEAPLVDQALRLVKGENIYRRDISSPPYTVTNYPPLYILLNAPFNALFGPNFWSGRLISALSAVASAIFLGLTVRAQTKNRRAARITTLLFLSIPYVVGWSKLMRIDLLALALSTAALYSISRQPGPKRGLLGTALLLVAAAYTRQSYGLAAPFAAFVWLWSQKGWREALKLAGLVAGLGLGLFLVLNLWSGGGFFFHIVSANVNPFDIETLKRYVEELREILPFLIICAAFLFLIIPRRDNGKLKGCPAWWLGAPYLIGATLTAATIGKVGSNINYLLELCAALSLSSGLVLAWSQHIWNNSARTNLTLWKPFIRAAVQFLLVLQIGLLLRFTLQRPVQDLKWRLHFEKSLKDLEWTVKETEGPILADEYMGLLTLSGKELYIQPFEITQLANAGLWKQDALLEKIHAQEYGLILIHHFPGWPVYKERWTPEMLEAIMENYSATQIKAETLLFRPRNTIAEREPAGLQCDDAPWPLPTQGKMGLWWFNKYVLFMGAGYENTIPVYAVADGLLSRDALWDDAVAIQHEDPLNPGETIWTFYGGMIDARRENSFVSADFPAGSTQIAVKAGQLLGYQGRWLEGQGPIWVHASFAIVPALEDGSFPAALVDRGRETDPPIPYEIIKKGRLDPSLYLGTFRTGVAGSVVWLPFRCKETMP